MLDTDQYLQLLNDTLARVDRDAVSATVAELERLFTEGRRLFVCGNGGSASTSSHLVCDFQKSLIAPNGRCLKAFALTDSQPLITAWANDFHYDQIFSGQLGVLGEAGDTLLAISGSGNSPNVLNAVRRAREMGMTTLGWSGYQGGKLAGMVDLNVLAPVENMQVAEDAHMIIGHIVFTRLLQALPRLAGLDVEESIAA